MSQVKSTTVNSVKWSSIQRLSVYVLQFFISIILARQLAPSDYGLVAMLTIFTSIAQVFIDSGFSQALIQKQERTEVDYSTVFYFNIGVGLLLYLLYVLCAPLISNFYEEPELINIIQFVGLNFIINSFATVQRAIISIKLEFKRYAIISLTATLLSGASAIWMAYHGFGVWTMVYMVLINSSSETLLLWLTSRWHPILVFSLESFNELFSFGSKLLGSNMLHQIYKNIYNVIIGKAFTPADLGYFNRAFTLSTTPSNIFTSTIARAVYPIECRIQDQVDLLAEKFLVYIKMTSILVFPLMAGIACVSESLVDVILTEKWSPSVPYIKIICIAYMFDPIMGIAADLLSVKRRGDLVLKSEILKKISALLILIVTLFFGVKVMCMGLILYSIVDMGIIFTFIRKVIPGVNITSVLHNIWPILMCTAVMYVLTSLTQFLDISSTLKLAVGVVVGVISYLFVGLMIMPKNMKMFFDLIRKIV